MDKSSGEEPSLKLYNFSGPEDVRLISMPRYRDIVIPFRNRRLKAPDPISCYYAHQEIFEREIYDFSTVKLRPRIIDCGANIGLSVIFFKSRYPDAQITAVEADPSIFSYLSQNLEEFGYQEVELISKAVSHDRQDIVFYAEGADGGRTGIPVNIEGSGSLMVKCLTIDDLIAGREVDFLKIDIEGEETAAILASENLQLVNKLFVEYHSFSDKKQTLDELLEKLSCSGFRYYISTVYCPKNPFRNVETDLGMDLQLNISCIRGR